MYDSLFLEQRSKEQNEETTDWSKWTYIQRTVCTIADDM